MFHININSDTFFKGTAWTVREAILRRAPNGVKSSTCIGQTVTDMGCYQSLFQTVNYRFYFTDISL